MKRRLFVFPFLLLTVLLCFGCSPAEEHSTSAVSTSSEAASSVSENVYDNIGPLFAPYLSLMREGKYRITTVENRAIGGESVPCTTTLYYFGTTVYGVIEESYGATSEFLLTADGTYLLDNAQKQALFYAGNTTIFTPEAFWKGRPSWTGSGKETLAATGPEYDCESYADEAGNAFRVYFENGVLSRYASYDEARADTVLIHMDITRDVSGAVFSIPEDYAVITIPGTEPTP